MNNGVAIVCVAACALAGMAWAQQATPAIPLDGFADGIQHWRNAHGDDYPRHAADDTIAIADNLLMWQGSDGGWPVNQDPARVLDADARAFIAAERERGGGSFDNRNGYTQVEYLAAAFARTGDACYRDASARGLEFILAQQLPACGGWPHTVPGTQPYHGLITMADDVTAGVLTTLRKAGWGDAPFDAMSAALAPPLDARIRAAVARGEDCLLRLQVRRGDALAGWAGQYDPQTLQPVQGRSFELPAIAVQETVGIVRYLMRIPDPPPQVVAAIEGAVAWLRRVSLQGMRLETFETKPAQFRYHATRQDRRLVAAPDASPLWGRFYDLRDDSVVLATREGLRVAGYAEIPRERRTGYDWYGHWPQALLERDYPRWKRACGC